MYKSIIFLLTFLCLFSFIPISRDSNYKGLLEKLCRKPDIICRWPLKDFKLKKDKINDYEEFLAAQGKDLVDSNLLKELISKSEKPATSAWYDSDFKRSIFVIDTYHIINKDSTISLLKKEGRKDINHYITLIQKFNSASTDNFSINPGIRRISYYS